MWEVWLLVVTDETLSVKNCSYSLARQLVGYGVANRLAGTAIVPA